MTQRFGDEPQAITGGRVIAKAIIKRYVSATHVADVQIVGSHPTVLSTIRVATDIPAADVVAGRQCTVLFLDPANQDDAVIITIQGALPSAAAPSVPASATVVAETAFGQAPSAGIAATYNRGDHTHGTPADPGGGVTDHALLTNLTYASAAHTGFAGTFAANTFMLLQTFNKGLRLAAGEPIEDSGGAARITLATASPHVTLSGEIRAGDKLAVGIAPAASDVATIQLSGAVASDRNILNILTSSFSFSASGLSLHAIIGNPSVSVPSANAGSNIRGLFFTAGVGGGGGGAVVSELTAARVLYAILSFTGTLTAGTGIRVVRPIILAGAPSVTLSTGIHIEDVSRPSVVDGVSLSINDITQGSGYRRLIDAGPTASRNLRLEANAPSNPGAGLGRAQLLLSFNENGTISLRRIEHKAGNALGADDKVLVAV